MNILYGLAVPDAGEILLDGQPVEIASPHDAIDRGHQHGPPALHAGAGPLGGGEHPPRRGADGESRSSSTAAGAHSRISELGERFGWRDRPGPGGRHACRSAGSSGSRSSRRSTAMRKIARPRRADRRAHPAGDDARSSPSCAPLRAEGYAIIFISHKLYEVLEIADRITVIRRGKVVGSRIPAETDEDDLAEMMVGREVQLTVDRGESHPGEPMLVVRGLTVRDDRHREVVHEVDFEVRAGEIFGIAGVAGNGQDELVEALVGLRHPAGGDDHPRRRERRRLIPARPARPGARLRAGRPATLRPGAQLPAHRQSRAQRLLPRAVRSRPGPRRRRPSRATRSRRSSSTTCGPRPPTVPASTLSGGNQQKLVVAREFEGDLRLLVLDQPTRGLDVGSIEFIHKQAIARRDAGIAILLVSAELDEVLELSDRIGVMYRRSAWSRILDGRSREPRGGRPADGDRRSESPAARLRQARWPR